MSNVAIKGTSEVVLKIPSFFMNGIKYGVVVVIKLWQHRLGCQQPKVMHL